MDRESSWVAAMLAGLLIDMALLSPARPEGQLPTLADTERPPATICRVPLVGPVIGWIQRQITLVTWQLEAVPME